MRNCLYGIKICLCHIILALLLIVGFTQTKAFAIEGPDLGGGSGGFLGEGIDFKGGMLDWEEDEEGHRVAILRNYAAVILPQLTISARNMVLNVEMQEIYAEGDVVFDEAGGNAFYCDQLTFNYQEWKGLAKNIRVKMDREDVTIPIRDFLDSQPVTSTTNTRSINEVGEADRNLRRMYVQAQELRAHDSQTFELIDAKITPSSFARPHWYFHSPAALFRQKEKIESYHNTVRVGRLPVLYFPYLIRDLQYDWPWMRISGGHTGDYGYFVRTQWGWKLRERPDAYFQMDKIIFDADVYSRRGTGVGVETTYKMGDLDSLGKLKLYGVYEYGISKSRDLKRALSDNEDKIYSNAYGYNPSLYRDKFRWAVDWEHYQQLNELWDIRAEAHLYHDRDYLKDYDGSRYWNEKEPENSIDVRRLDKHWELEFVASSRLSNKWQTSAEYLPEMRLTVPNMQIGDTQLFLKNDFRMGLINRRFDEDEYRYTRWDQLNLARAAGDIPGYSYPSGGLFERDPVTGMSTSRLHDKDNYGTSFRVLNDMRIEAPLKLWESVTLKPWVGLRTAYYSKTQGRAYSNAEIEAMSGANPYMYQYYENGIYNPTMRYKSGSGDYNFAIPFGGELSTRTYTLFGANNQWRLITEPVLSYTENSRPRLDYDRDLYPVDSYDEYYRQRRLGVELHNKLQRRYYEDAPGEDVPERDVLDFNVAFYQYPRERDRDVVNNGNRFSEIAVDLVYRPMSHLSLSASVDYDVDDNTANRAIVSADWRINNYVRTYVTHYHYRGRYWRHPTTSPSSQTHMAVRTKLWNDSSHYSLEGAVAYEWRDSNEWRTTRDGVRHGFSKYRVTLFRDMDTFEMALSYVRDRNADDHGVFFSLSPKGFMGFDRPPPGYSMEIEELSAGRYPETSRYLDAGYLIDGPVRDADIKDVQF